MRTVGPLPPAIYWRRRAIVLGSVLVAALLVVYACTPGKSATNPAAKTKPTAAAAPSPKPTNTTNPFLGASASPAPAESPAPAPSPTGPPLCTDDEISVVAKVDQPAMPRGAFMTIFLKIKNISTHPCTRDVGADAQEAKVMQGDTRVWSSDDCDPPHGSKLVELIPQTEQEFRTAWNSLTSTPACGKDRPLAAIGDYTVVIRFEKKQGTPIQVKLT